MENKKIAVNWLIEQPLLARLEEFIAAQEIKPGKGACFNAAVRSWLDAKDAS